MAPRARLAKKLTILAWPPGLASRNTGDTTRGAQAGNVDRAEVLLRGQVHQDIGTWAVGQVSREQLGDRIVPECVEVSAPLGTNLAAHFEAVRKNRVERTQYTVEA